jgi:hypothetical protein
MHKLIAVIVAVAPMLACTPYNETNRQSTLNEATPTSGIGNTGAAGTAAAGPSVNSQSRTEAEREGR